jgi:hypothetical protein
MADTPKEPKPRHGDLILLLFVVISMSLVIVEILGNLVSYFAS